MKSGVGFDDNSTTLRAQKLVQRLQEAKFGDLDRLDYIKKAIESGNTLYESDKQYLEEKSKQLQRIIDTQTKAELVMQAFNKLHESELRDSQRLDAIKKELQQGKQVAENEVNFLNTKYEELQQEIDHQKRVQWTIGVIKRLQEAEIGDHTRLEVIKSALEEGRSVEQGEVSYLKEQYKLLQQIDAIKKVQSSIDSIKKLHEAEIGNYQRLERIKVALEKGRNVEPEEISYLKEKYEELLIIERSKTPSNKNNIENIEQKTQA